MEFKLSFKQSVLVIGIALILIFFFTFLNIKAGIANSSEAQVGDSIPIQIRIPAINVDTAIESVGVLSNNEMDVPKNIANTAWFNGGPIPGEIGSAVIDWHFGWKNGKKAVFDNLNKLNIGDKILITDRNGNTTVFIVRKIKTYGQNESTQEIFKSSDGKSHLNLITCSGDWNKTDESYPTRLVVFADKEIL